MDTVAILDFETTGLSPTSGDRPTELAVALVRRGRVVDRFQSLMNPGRLIPWDVTRLTGITNDMVAKAPPVREVMRRAAQFVGTTPIVAHNASFDRRFWLAELERAGLGAPPPFACTMLLSRRLYPDLPNYQLGTLVGALGLRKAERAHRAMADVEMTTQLWGRIEYEVGARYGLTTDVHATLCRLQRLPKAKALALLERR
jgi:DNA polymerase-3 subunit epsilon